MGKKKNNNNSNNNDGSDKKVVEEVQKEEKKGGDGGGEKKEEKNNAGAVVLKVDIHCEGCASKIVKCGLSFPGVESVKVDSSSNKVTVSGKVDPLKIRDYLHNKTKKKVELISPQPKKEDAANKNKEEKKPDDKKPEADKKKPKEAPVTTAVLKLSLHCQGCIDKIRKTVSKTKGVHDMSLDKQKETVTVKGTMDVKALTESLKERLKRPVEIVPPKKEKEGSDGAEKGGDNKDGKKGGGGDNKDGKKGGGGGGNGEQQQQQFHGFDGDAGIRMEGNMMVHPGFVGRPIYGDGFMGRPVYGDGYMGQPVYGYGHDYGYGYGPVPVPGYPAHMQFNDENPNACTIM